MIAASPTSLKSTSSPTKSDRKNDFDYIHLMTPLSTSTTTTNKASTSVFESSAAAINRSLESVFHAARNGDIFQNVVLRKVHYHGDAHINGTERTLKAPISSQSDLGIIGRRKSKSESKLNFLINELEESSCTSKNFNGRIGGNYNKSNEKTEDILAKALEIALKKQEALRKTESDQNSQTVDGEEDSEGSGSSRSDLAEHSCKGPAPNRMMMSTPPPGVQTDSDGLILPKKVLNPCLESSDRKNLHRELMFNNKIGKSVLNQKTELQRALEKQKERQLFLEQQHQQKHEAKIESGLKGELNRVIMERAQKLEKQLNPSNQDQELDSQYVNPEYLNARAKLRAGRIEMK